MELTVGMKLCLEDMVTEANTAAALGSGRLPVYATPALAALLENCACTLLEGCLPEGSGSVGTFLELHHTAPTPVGMSVWAEAEVTEIDGRRVRFAVKAGDAAGDIAHGAHERFVIDNARFLAKAEKKRESRPL